MTKGDNKNLSFILIYKVTFPSFLVHRLPHLMKSWFPTDRDFEENGAGILQHEKSFNSQLSFSSTEGSHYPTEVRSHSNSPVTFKFRKGPEKQM